MMLTATTPIKIKSASNNSISKITTLPISAPITNSCKKGTKDKKAYFKFLIMLILYNGYPDNRVVAKPATRYTVIPCFAIIELSIQNNGNIALTSFNNYYIYMSPQDLLPFIVSGKYLIMFS